MPDREKVIALLERYVDIPNLAGVENYGAKIVDMPAPLIADTLALLKAQEARVMTWEESQVNVKDGPFIIFEVRDSTGSEIDFGVLAGDFYEMSEGSVLTVADFWMMKDDYGKRFRLWTSRPTEEQREATPWN